MEKSNLELDQQLPFFANLVHEIRTPVQTIMGTLELLLDTNLNGEQREYIRQIQFSTNVLLVLVNDILDFAKIKSQHVAIESIPYDVVEITERVVDFVSVEAFNKGVELVVDADYTLPQLVTGDPTRVQQVLLNVIKNAVKFTDKGYVHLELSRRNENILLFKITDTGIGISEEEQKHIFTDFYQAGTSTSRKYGGTGLGLAICNKLVKAMHGKIGVKSLQNRGSLFWIMLPLVSGQNLSIGNATVRVPRESSFLIVDDNILAANSLQRKLNSFGVHAVTQSKNAQDALVKMENAVRHGKPFSVAFIDMSLPKVDGWHLAWKIKQKKIFNSTKLYLLVPEGQMGAEAKMKLINLFNGYVYKPVKRSLIQAVLKDIYDAPSELETLDIKHAEMQAQKSDNSSDDGTVAHGLTILVADDHPVNRKLLSTFLKKIGAETIEAENGKEAAEQIAQNQKIDMIFMDIQMPVMNGLEASKIIRAHKYAGIIIACTANTHESDFENCYKIGINDILVKPFKQTDIKAVIEKWRAVIDLPEAAKIATLYSLTEQTDGAWNQNDFEDSISGNTQFGCELIDDYSRQLSQSLSQIKTALERKDFEELRRIGHKIKGSSAAISAYSLAKCGERINKQAKKSDIMGVQASFNALKDEFAIFEISAHTWQMFKMRAEMARAF
ncbi:MAG: response regulator [Treponema sp.]|nr:response regulator [Treponema sp.]